MEISRLEVTTVIGCPGNGCGGFCAQDVFVKKYFVKGAAACKELTVERWEKILGNLPSSISIWFGSYSESLGNKDFVKLAKLAVDHGHEISLFTTLLGASNKLIDELVKFKWQIFMLHLADGKYLKLPNDLDYALKIGRILTEIPNSEYMRMGENFRSCRREDYLRQTNIPRRRNVVACSRDVFGNYQPVMTPDGEVYSCCMDMGLSLPMGNLINQDWAEIAKKISECKNDFPEFCKYCVLWGLTRRQVFNRQVRQFMQKIGGVNYEEIVKS